MRCSLMSSRSSVLVPLWGFQQRPMLTSIFTLLRRLPERRDERLRERFAGVEHADSPAVGGGPRVPNPGLLP